MEIIKTYFTSKRFVLLLVATAVVTILALR